MVLQGHRVVSQEALDQAHAKLEAAEAALEWQRQTCNKPTEERHEAFSATPTTVAKRR